MPYLSTHVQSKFTFQGDVTVKYHDGSFVTGNIAEGNQFYGLVRLYDSKLKLQGIINLKEREISAEDAKESDFLWI